MAGMLPSQFPSNYLSPQLYDGMDGSTLRMPKSIADLNSHLSIPRFLDEDLELDLLPNSNAFQREDNYLEHSKNTFRILLNVASFKPEEIDIKVLDDLVVVHAKHEEKYDRHGSVFREFTRSFKIPEEVDSFALKSIFYKSGVLALRAPMKSKLPEDGRILPLIVVRSLGDDVLDSVDFSAAQHMGTKQASVGTTTVQ